MTKKQKLLRRLRRLPKRTLIIGATAIVVGSVAATIYALQAPSKTPVKQALNVSNSSGNSSVPICVEGSAGCPTFGSSSNQSISTSTPSTSSSSSSSPTTDTKPATSSTSASSGPSDAEIAALYCSGEFATIQTNDQTNLDNSRISAISNAQGEINTYNEYGSEPNPTVTVASVNQFIDQENSGMASSYQQYVSGLTPSANAYGCTITLRQEAPLPSFNPLEPWNT